jgi:hypothetical protein
MGKCAVLYRVHRGWSDFGSSRRVALPQDFGRFRSESDIGGLRALNAYDASDATATLQTEVAAQQQALRSIMMHCRGEREAHARERRRRYTSE